MKLLLIEENPQLAVWPANLLRAQDFVVDHVEDGDAADILLRQARYDVVLLDLNIPGLSGKGVLRRLRERRDDVPVIVLTAAASRLAPTTTSSSRSRSASWWHASGRCCSASAVTRASSCVSYWRGRPGVQRRTPPTRPHLADTPRACAIQPCALFPPKH